MSVPHVMRTRFYSLPKIKSDIYELAEEAFPSLLDTDVSSKNSSSGVVRTVGTHPKLRGTLEDILLLMTGSTS
jgi:hypothetical protein